MNKLWLIPLGGFLGLFGLASYHGYFQEFFGVACLLCIFPGVPILLSKD